MWRYILSEIDLTIIYSVHFTSLYKAQLYLQVIGILYSLVEHLLTYILVVTFISLVSYMVQTPLLFVMLDLVNFIPSYRFISSWLAQGGSRCGNLLLRYRFMCWRWRRWDARNCDAFRSSLECSTWYDRSLERVIIAWVRILANKATMGQLKPTQYMHV